MEPPLDPLLALRQLDFLHITITLSLFLLNFFVTHAIGKQRLIARANYLGPEMIYLAAAIVASHLFTASPDSRLVAVVSIFPYLVLWAGGLHLTKRVIEVGRDSLHPLTVVNLLGGAVAVFLSLTGTVETFFEARL